MSILWKLVKINLLNSLTNGNQFSSKKNKTTKKPATGIILMWSFLFVFALIYVVMFAGLANSVNRQEAIVTFGAGFGSFMVFVFTFAHGYTALFSCRDNEMLMCLPLKNSTIVASKIISFTLINYMYFLVFYLPSVVGYLILGTITVPGVIGLFVGFILGPLMSITLSIFLSYIVGRLLSKFKYKNILSSVIMLVAFIAIFSFSFSITSTSTGTDMEAYANSIIDNITGAVTYVSYSSIWLTKSLLGDWLSLMWFVLASSVPFILFIYLASISFVKENGRSKNGYKVKNFTLKGQARTSQVNALLKKEFKTIISNSIVLINTAIGPLLSTVLIVVYLIVMPVFEPSQLSQYAPILVVAISGFAIGMSPSTASSISLEGKNFWIIKTSPISAKRVFIAKTLTYVLICLPFIIANIVVTIVVASPSVLDMILMPVIILVITIAYALVGLWINVAKPKLDWDNMTQVMKNSAGQLLTMLADFIIDIILFVPMILLAVLKFPSLPIVLGLSIIVMIMAGAIVFNHSVKQYDALNV